MLQHLPTHFLLMIPFLPSKGYFIWTLQAVYQKGRGAIIHGERAYFTREEAMQDATRFLSSLATTCPMIDESGEAHYPDHGGRANILSVRSEDQD